MKTKHLLIQSCLLTAGLLALLPAATAQTYTVTKSFTNILEGILPRGLILDRGTLYGATEQGGSQGYGTLFKVNPDGTGYVVLKDFTNSIPENMPADGANPFAGMIMHSNVLYGTTVHGGAGVGILFRMNPDGSDFALLWRFHGSDGDYTTAATYPSAGLVASCGVLYGTTASGGEGLSGVVFRINTDGSGFTNLVNFSGNFDTDPDGAVPLAKLTLCSNVLYGTTAAGGADHSDGTVFKVNTDGSGYAILHNFTNNPDGASPHAGLTLSGNVLYGTTSSGGTGGRGTIFQVNTDGTGYTVIRNFTQDLDDGGDPEGELMLAGKVLYGTTRVGGTPGAGTVFAINTDGTGFTILKNYAGNDTDDGSDPQAGLLLAGSTLYGATYEAGDQENGVASNGTLFSMDLTPSLAINATDNQVVLSWPNWAPNFSLQTTTNLAAPVWTAVSNAPVVIEAQTLVTNTMSGDQQFFRLSQ